MKIYNINFWSKSELNYKTAMDVFKLENRWSLAFMVNFH